MLDTSKNYSFTIFEANEQSISGNLQFHTAEGVSSYLPIDRNSEIAREFNIK